MQGFPTIKFFRDGVPSDYNGPREKEGIVTYCPAPHATHALLGTCGGDAAAQEAVA